MRPRTSCLLQLLLLAFFPGTTTEAARRASFGEPCSPGGRCDSRKYLTCSNDGVCACLMSNSMIFDDTTKQCVTLAGERCEFTTVEGDRSWSDVVPCIDHAACKNGMCECGPDYFELSNGTCHEKGIFAQNCVSSDMCQEKYDLVCGADNKCNCRQNRVFSQNHGECVLRAGEPCSSSEKCTEYSTCSGRCTCQPEFFQSDDGTCQRKRSLGQACVHRGQCQENVQLPARGIVPTLMKCLQGKCECDPDVAAPFSRDFPGNLSCGKRLNMPCSHRENNNCIQGAMCDSTTDTCQCEPLTYFPTETDTCEPRKLYGQPCSEYSPCNYHKKRLNCSGTTNTCTCVEGSVIDPDSQECRGSPGTRCYYYTSHLSCVAKAECRKYSDKCECVGEGVASFRLPDYCYINKGGSCFGDVHEPITSRTCLPGLLCSNRTCSCLYKDFQTFNLEKEKCFSNLRGPCNNTEDCDVVNSECGTHADSGDLLQCRCKEGFMEVRGACQIAFGGKCRKTGEGRADEDTCDTVGPLECSSRGICECVKQQVYDNQTSTCRGLVGAKCDLQWKGGEEEGPRGFCVEGAFCKRFRGSPEHVGACKCYRGWKVGPRGTCKSPVLVEMQVPNPVDIPPQRNNDTYSTLAAESSAEKQT